VALSAIANELLGKPQFPVPKKTTLNSARGRPEETLAQSNKGGSLGSSSEEKYSPVLERIIKVRSDIEGLCNLYFPSHKIGTPQRNVSANNPITVHPTITRLPTKIKSSESQKQSTFKFNLLEATVTSGNDSAVGFSVKMYIVEKMGLKKQQAKQSKVVSTTQNPKWNESFAFLFEKNVKITVEILEEFKGKTTIVGKVKISPKIYSADTKKEIISSQKGQEKRGDLVFSGEIFPGNIVNKLISEGCK